MNNPRVARYLTTPEVSEIIYMASPAIRAALIEHRFPPPDIRIGPRKGWDRKRITAFAVWAGHINKKGERLTEERLGRKAGIKPYDPSKWDVKTEKFYSLSDIAELANSYRMAISELFWRDAIVKPDVGLGDMYGWSEAKAKQIAAKFRKGGIKAFTEGTPL